MIRQEIADKLFNLIDYYLETKFKNRAILTYFPRPLYSLKLKDKLINIKKLIENIKLVEIVTESHNEFIRIIAQDSYDLTDAINNNEFESLLNKSFLCISEDQEKNTYITTVLKTDNALYTASYLVINKPEYLFKTLKNIKTETTKQTLQEFIKHKWNEGYVCLITFKHMPLSITKKVRFKDAYVEYTEDEQAGYIIINNNKLTFKCFTFNYFNEIEVYVLTYFQAIKLSTNELN